MKLIVVTAAGLCILWVVVNIPSNARHFQIVRLMSKLNPHDSTIAEQTQARSDLGLLGTNIQTIILSELTAKSDIRVILLGPANRRRQNAFLALQALQAQPQDIVPYLPSLKELLKSETTSEYQAAIRAMSLFGDLGASSLVDELGSASSTEKETILATLSGMKLGPEPISKLFQIIHASQNATVYEVAGAISLTANDQQELCNTLNRHSDCSNKWCHEGVQFIRERSCDDSNEGVAFP